MIGNRCILDGSRKQPALGNLEVKGLLSALEVGGRVRTSGRLDGVETFRMNGHSAQFNKKNFILPRKGEGLVWLSLLFGVSSYLKGPEFLGVKTPTALVAFLMKKGL